MASDPIVDAHVHLFGRGFLPAYWYENVRRKWEHKHWPTRDGSDLDIEAGLVDEEGVLLLQQMETAGIDTALVLTLDWGHAYGEPDVPIREVHQRYGELQRAHPGRIFAAAGVDPRRPDALSILEAAIEGDGLKGLKLYPPLGFDPGDDRCWPLYDYCASMGVPVVIHTAFVGFPHIGAHAQPPGVGAVQRAFPGLTLVLAHGGHPHWVPEAISVAASHPHTYLEISNWDYDIDADPELVKSWMRKAVEEVGAHRILFGSDHLGGKRFSGSRSHLGGWRGFIEGLATRDVGILSDEQLNLVLGANARRVFALDGRS